MKSMKQLMEELGFKKESSFETKKSFIKNLIRQAEGENVISLREWTQKMNKKNLSQQLSFDFDDEIAQ